MFLYKEQKQLQPNSQHKNRPHTNYRIERYVRNESPYCTALWMGGVGVDSPNCRVESSQNILEALAL